MLINRTYRTWIYDYPQYYAGSSVSSHRTPSTSCPNNISAITAGVSSTNNTFVADSFLSVNLNNSSGNNTTYIELYNGNYSGFNADTLHPFYGQISPIGTNVIANGFVNIGVNGLSSYVKIYTGPANSTCSTTLRCSSIPNGYGTLIQYGYAIINAAGSYKFIKVYTLQ